MIGITTVRQGERVAVWDRGGRVRMVDGPRRLLLWGQTVQRLPRTSAEADEYLVILFKDRRAEHIPGPAAAWFDPVLHETISVAKALPLDANEALVFYERTGRDVRRAVLRGPAMYVPTENQWLHQFSWHGADPRTSNRKVPRGLQFTKLRVIPDQMYFDVEDVRTADDALLVVRLMVFFELVDIDRMLDQTHDPIADFINAVSADVIDHTASRSFEHFKEQTERLNDLGTYRNLTMRAERIGYRVTKVVYRGYHASAKLQAMHDGAIEARTGLKLDAETETQSQALADLKLERESQRASQRQRMEIAAAEHETRVKRMAHEESLRQRDAEQQRELERNRLTDELDLARRTAANKERLSLLSGMRAMQIDLTQYLVAQYRNPDRLIRIEGRDKPQLHLHQ